MTLAYIEQRIKVLNLMRAFADREGKIAFDNMIHELEQVKTKLLEVIGEIERLSWDYHTPDLIRRSEVLKLLKGAEGK